MPCTRGKEIKATVCFASFATSVQISWIGWYLDASALAPMVVIRFSCLSCLSMLNSFLLISPVAAHSAPPTLPSGYSQLALVCSSIRRRTTSINFQAPYTPPYRRRFPFQALTKTGNKCTALHVNHSFNHFMPVAQWAWMFPEGARGSQSQARPQALPPRWMPTSPP